MRLISECLVYVIELRLRTSEKEAGFKEVQTVPFCVHRWTPNGQECCKQLSDVLRIREVTELRTGC
jgi:hypothetical protein